VIALYEFGARNGKCNALALLWVWQRRPPTVSGGFQIESVIRFPVVADFPGYQRDIVGAAHSLTIDKSRLRPASRKDYELCSKHLTSAIAFKGNLHQTIYPLHATDLAVADDQNPSSLRDVL
jgi:hypothetical protein